MATIQKRINQDGKITHRVLIRLKGFPVQTASFERLTDAREWARNTETAIKERRYFKTTESKKRSVKDMIERYLKYLESHNSKRIADVTPMLAWWKQELGYVILADLTRAQISEKVDLLSEKRVKVKGKIQKISPARINRYISAFSHCCSYAVNQWEWLEQNPMQKIKKKTEPRGRVRFLDDAERARLLAVCEASSNRQLYLIVVLAISTGARKGEILNLKWKDVDFQRGIITLHETKNGERRILPLTGKALSLFQDHKKVRRIDTQLVFPSSTGEKPTIIRDAWEAALKKANIEDCRFHDLRHSAASYLAMNGASLAEIAEVLGHKTLQMVKRYSHLSDAHTHNVVAKMNERIFRDG